MTRGLLALLFFAGSIACALESDVAGDQGYRCSSDDDCAAGFFCSNCETGDDGTVGRCVTSDEVCGSECVDLDGDGTFVGTECPPGREVDCDDSDGSTSPLAEEQCDGVDNDCDGVVDEDQPTLDCPRQIGVCLGAQSACVDGDYEDCGESGAYGPAFESNETSCDGADNDCDGDVDEECECDPATERGTSCGIDTGPCTRGVRLCESDGQRSACIASTLERACEDGSSCQENCDDGSACAPLRCESDSDCSPDSLCVAETLLGEESATDDCIDAITHDCTRTVCRTPVRGTPCDTDRDCPTDEFCAGSACRAGVVQPLDGELCNGVDDDCDGGIDNDEVRDAICGPCPFNTAFIAMSIGGRQEFVCVDYYEASRPDASATSVGESEFYAVSRAGVLPWTGASDFEARDACAGTQLEDAFLLPFPAVANKRLCTAEEWSAACGTAQFPYGDTYVAGLCADASVTDATVPTGSLTECCAGGICDLSGNVGEYVLSDGAPFVAGGSYLDAEGPALSCDSILPVPEDTAGVGFRCCVDRR